MAQVTQISDESGLGQDPRALYLIEQWKKALAQEGGLDKVLADQGANVSSANLAPQQIPQVTQLAQQGMTRGLTVTGNPNDPGLTYTGGVAGFAGPVDPREMDNFQSGTSTNQSQYDAVRQQQQARLQPGPGGAPMGKLMDLLGATKSLGPSSYGAVNQMVKEGILPRGLEQINPEQAKIDIARAKLGTTAQNSATAAHQRNLNNLGQYYNRTTGKPAIDDFPEGNPDAETLNSKYIKLVGDSAKKLDALRGLDGQISNYENLIDELPLAEKEGALNAFKSGMTIKAMRLGNDIAVRELDAAQAQLVALARSLGGTSRSADTIRELQRLEKAVITDYDSKEGARAAIAMLKKYRDDQARGIPIPGLRNRYGAVNIEPGTVLKGYRFKGGAPSDKNNWEPVQ